MAGAPEPRFPRLPYVPSKASLIFLNLDRWSEAVSRWGLIASGGLLCAYGLGAGILILLR